MYRSTEEIITLLEHNFQKMRLCLTMAIILDKCWHLLMNREGAEQRRNPQETQTRSLFPVWCWKGWVSFACLLCNSSDHSPVNVSRLESRGWVNTTALVWKGAEKRSDGLCVWAMPIYCSDVVMDMEKQQLYPSQTKRMVWNLICYILLRSKGKQGYWDRSVKLRLKNRQGTTQVMGSLIIYHWYVTQNMSVGLD